MPPRRRVLRVLRWIAVLIILIGPIGAAALEMRDGVPAGALPASDERVARYLGTRSAQIDHLLPDGAGGTRFYESLDDALGKAFTHAAAIGIAVSAGNLMPLESVELHERAHLIDAFLPAEVAALMVRVPAPAEGELAAKDPGQHFAEMAAHAWLIVAPPPNDVCVDGTPADQLERAEARVPGTAGFVLRYLKVVPPPDDAQRLRELADRLSAPQRNEWNAIWRGVDARRRIDGTFEPWTARSIREQLAARRAELWISGNWIDRTAALAILPSLAIVTAAELVVD